MKFPFLLYSLAVQQPQAVYVHGVLILRIIESFRHICCFFNVFLTKSYL